MAPDWQENRPIRARYVLKIVALLAPMVISCGCSSGPYSLTQLAGRTQVRVRQAPMESVSVRLGSDRRPPGEHGSTYVSKESWLGSADLIEPSEVSVLSLAARGLVRSGLAKSAPVAQLESPFSLDIHILNLGASFDAGLVESLAPIAPTSAIDAHCRIRWVLKDEYGRVYVDETTESRESDSAALVGGISRKAAQSLALCLRRATDKALETMDGAVDRFWKKLGRPRPLDE